MLFQNLMVELNLILLIFFFLLKITLVDYRSTDSSVYSDLFRNFYHITNRYNTKIASTGVYRRPWKFSPSVSNIKRYIKININIYQTLYTKLQIFERHKFSDEEYECKLLLSPLIIVTFSRGPKMCYPLRISRKFQRLF